MVKTKIQVLEEMFNKILMMVTDSEIQIEYLKGQDQKLVVYSKKVSVAGQPMQKDFTAEMLVKAEEAKLKENNTVLDIIRNRIATVHNSETKQISASPSGPTS